MNDELFVAAVVACLAADGAPERRTGDALHARVAELLFGAPERPGREQLARLDAGLREAAGAPAPLVGLVLGGATKVKDYIFEAPRLPEIRGASALLDWVNTKLLRELWVRELGDDFARAGYTAARAAELAAATIVYSSGGNFLALAPAGPRARELAALIECTFNDWTFVAQSVAVAMDAPLLALRYGHNPLAYWVEEFRASLEDETLAALLGEAYPPLPGQPDDERFFARKGFGELVDVLGAAFYRRRDERAAADPPLPPSLYPYSPWDEPCVSSTMRPAVYSGRVSADEDEKVVLSAPAARRRYVGQIVKRDKPGAGDWYPEAEGWRRPEGLPRAGWAQWRKELTSWEQAWEAWLANGGAGSNYARAVKGQKLDPDTIFPARDVHEIGATSGRYIGMIYADGNRVGSWMQACRTPEEYRRRSNALDSATREAVFAALGAHLEPARAWRISGEQSIHPFEILTIGGDDILLIVPGDRALDVAVAIARSFEQSEALREAAAEPADAAAPTLVDRYRGPTGALPGWPCGPVAISAGVLIAREDTPIFFLRELVEELLKNAKLHARGRARERAEGADGPALARVGGAVDFMALKSISMVTNRIKEFRVRALGQERKAPDADTRRLTARPYTWHELGGLLATARALKAAEVPRSQLYRMREVLEQTRESGVVLSAIEYLYTRSRLRRGHASALLEQVEWAWRGSAQGDTLASSAPPWLRRADPRVADAGWETIWPDLVEIYEFAGRPEGAGAAQEA